MILTNERVKKLKSDSKSDELIKAIVSQQKKQDDAIGKALDGINKSLKAVKSFAIKSASSSNEQDKNLERLQMAMQASLEASMKALQTLSLSNKTDLTSVVNAIEKITNKIDNKPIVTSLKNINDNLDIRNNEWDFVIIRDDFGRIDSIKARGKY